MVGGTPHKACTSMCMLCMDTCSWFAQHPSLGLVTSVIDVSIVMGAVKDI